MFDGDTSETNLQVFWKAYVEKMKEEGIVDNFVRYHPVLANAVPMKQISTVIDLGKTIAFDLLHLRLFGKTSSARTAI